MQHLLISTKTEVSGECKHFPGIWPQTNKCWIYFKFDLTTIRPKFLLFFCFSEHIHDPFLLRTLHEFSFRSTLRCKCRLCTQYLWHYSLIRRCFQKGKRNNQTHTPGCRSSHRALLPDTTSPLSCHTVPYEEPLVPSTAGRRRGQIKERRVENGREKRGKEEDKTVNLMGKSSFYFWLFSN